MTATNSTFTTTNNNTIIIVWIILIRLKGIVHPKMKILSSFIHPQVVPNLYECLCSAEHKGRYSEECGKQSSFWGTIDFHSIVNNSMEVNGAPKQPGYKLSSKYLPLCLAEQRHSYRFGTTWGWINDDRIFIFGWTTFTFSRRFYPKQLTNEDIRSNQNQQTSNNMQVLWQVLVSLTQYT